MESSAAALQRESTPQSPASVLRSTAKVQPRQPPIFELMPHLLPQLTMQNLADTSWAMGKLRHREVPLPDAVSCQLSPDCHPQQLASVAWPLATLGHRSVSALSATGRGSQARRFRSSPRDIRPTWFGPRGS
ncbi:unnamed protein product [Effrenium voratum]|nr:unnamed protein product [Effrenium voratum]